MTASTVHLVLGALVLCSAMLWGIVIYQWRRLP